MSKLFFVDSNLIIYSLTSLDSPKARQAKLWLDLFWRTGTGRLSCQVLMECYSVLTRKASYKVIPETAEKILEPYLAWKPIALSSELLTAGWRITSDYKLSCWDGLIVAAAQLGRCRYLVTEDLSHGQVFDSLSVVNPFQVSPEKLV